MAISRTLPTIVGAALLVAFLIGLPVAAQTPDGFSQATREIAIGSEGEIYLVGLGAYGQLFPPGSPGAGLADPQNQALAIEILQADGSKRRLLVPGTETADFEDSASTLYENGSKTLFVLWQSRVNMIHWQLKLIGLRNGVWTEPVEISGNPFGWKSSPQLRVTRDSFVTETESGALQRWKRTVAHLIWREDGAPGHQLLYSPIVFIDGAYIGWNPVYNMADLGLTGGGTGLGASNTLLAEVPRIAAGHNAQSVVLAFVDDASRDVVTASIEVLPGEIAHLADRVRAQIIDVGRKRDSGEIRSLHDEVRAQIIDVGRAVGVHNAVAAYLAEDVNVTLEGVGPDEDFAALADRVRAQIIDVGSRLTDRGVDRSHAAARLHLIDLPTGQGSMTDLAEIDLSGPPASLIKLERISLRPAPSTGVFPHEVYLSKNGHDVVVAWREDGKVHYRESRGDGWSAVRTLRLGDDLDIGLALKLLSSRADELSSEK